MVLKIIFHIRFWAVKMDAICWIIGLGEERETLKMIIMKVGKKQMKILDFRFLGSHPLGKRNNPGTRIEYETGSVG